MIVQIVIRRCIMGLDNSKWIEIDKRQCVIDIIDGKIDLSKTDIKLVSLDGGFIDYVDDTDMVAIQTMITDGGIKFFKKVIDIDKYM